MTPGQPLFRSANAHRPDLERRPDEGDEPYRQRILAVIGSNDSWAREYAGRMYGTCLDSFASSVSHAAAIGWRVYHPTDFHRSECHCPPRIRRLIEDQRERLGAAEKAAEEARAEIARLTGLATAANPDLRETTGGARTACEQEQEQGELRRLRALVAELRDTGIPEEELDRAERERARMWAAGEDLAACSALAMMTAELTRLRRLLAGEAP